MFITDMLFSRRLLPKDDIGATHSITPNGSLGLQIKADCSWISCDGSLAA
jgi:hypothetical protein